MSAFLRHPMRQKYEAMAARHAHFSPAGVCIVKVSPQNRRIRFLADLEAAQAKRFPNHVTRQQSRWAKRKGYAA